MAADRLSSLPDDLLRRVLRFAPAREGAATAALSRRWRTIWRTSRAVNLVARRRRVNGGLESPEDFLRAAAAALDAADADADARVTRLTFLVEALYPHEVYTFLRPPGGERDVVAAVLSHPAPRRVEELRVVVGSDHLRGYYSLSFGALPSSTLRLLHLVGCGDLELPPPPAVVFPRLEAARLEVCSVRLSDLQRVVDAAPRLAALDLEHCSFQGDEAGGHGLHCPSLTSLALVNCRWWPREEDDLELHAPLLQYFSFEGHVGDARLVSLRKSPAASSLIRVDLQFGRCARGGNELNETIRDFFWQLVRNFSVTKVLKVKLEFGMGHIAIVDEKDRDAILGTDLLSNVERLELQGRYDPESNSDAMAIANFLHCCPVLRDLRLKLNTEASQIMRIVSPLQRHQLDLDKSIDNFRRRRRSMIPLGVDDDDNYYAEVSDIPCLSEHSFNCLQSYLRRVSLQFWMEDQTRFGIQLAKFFADNALVLEEMHIADGCHKMCEHINRRIGRWAARRRNSRFTVLPGQM
ncbi:hypothetical protein ACP4OV_022025 [Aristida adscensionis]